MPNTIFGLRHIKAGVLLVHHLGEILHGVHDLGHLEDGDLKQHK